MTDYLYAVIRDLGSQLRKERARADELEALRESAPESSSNAQAHTDTRKAN